MYTLSVFVLPSQDVPVTLYFSPLGETISLEFGTLRPLVPFMLVMMCTTFTPPPDPIAAYSCATPLSVVTEVNFLVVYVDPVLNAFSAAALEGYDSPR